MPIKAVMSNGLKVINKAANTPVIAATRRVVLSWITRKAFYRNEFGRNSPRFRRLRAVPL